LGISLAKTDEVVLLVHDMVLFQPTDRISLQSVFTRLQALTPQTKRKTIQDFGLIYDNEYFTTLNTLNESFNTTNISFNPAIYSLSQTVNFKNMSSEIHDQGDSYFCWAITIATILKSELKRLVMTLCLKENKITREEMSSLLKLVNSLNENEKLMKELACLVIPRKLKFTKSHTDLSTQTSTVIGSVVKNTPYRVSVYLSIYIG